MKDSGRPSVTITARGKSGLTKATSIFVASTDNALQLKSETLLSSSGLFEKIWSLISLSFNSLIKFNCASDRSPFSFILSVRPLSPAGDPLYLTNWSINTPGS